MADPDLEMTVKPAPGPIGGVATHYNLDNERLDCDNLGNSLHSSLFFRVM